MTASAPELVTLGETMYCLIPGSSGPLRYAADFRPRIAGAESNLAIGMAKLGHSASWISRLGDDEFGRHVNNLIRAEGVDVSGVVFDPAHRTGLMFKEMSAGETRVYYYRENSAASHLTPDDLSTDLIAGARILHLTGITPILSGTCQDAVFRAMDMAREAGVLISFDPNVRRKLWRDRDYAPLLKELTLRSDLVMLGLDEAEAILATTEPEEIFEILLDEGDAKGVAIKNGGDGSWVGDRHIRKLVPPLKVACIEPIGAGDAFNAGFLCGWLEQRDVETCGRMGNIAGGLATQVIGDIEGMPDRPRMDALLASAKEVYR